MKRAIAILAIALCASAALAQRHRAAADPFIAVAVTTPSDCHTSDWYMNADVSTCRALFVTPSFPDCYGLGSLTLDDGTVVRAQNRCFFGQYPPFALYDVWIPGDFGNYLKPYGYDRQTQIDPSLPSLATLYHALGYNSGDAVWQVPATTLQVSYVQFRQDGRAPTDLPPTGNPITGVFGAPFSGPQLVGIVP